MKFYTDIPAFQDFEQINKIEFFHQAPDDWLILISDIKGSTQAAQEGRSKEVNMLGAAIITLVANSIDNLQVPYVFGGDGATLLMPITLFESLRSQMAGLVKLAQNQFGMTLRIGAVKVKDLQSEGHSVMVGKYESSPQSQFAQFLGSGFSIAEKWIKACDTRTIQVTGDEAFVTPQLNGLSCRLQPFDSQKGIILSLIIRSKNTVDSSWVRGELLQEIKKILDNNFNLSNPVKSESLKWKLIPSTFWNEVAMEPNSLFKTFKVLIKVLLANVMLNLNISGGGFIPKKYKDEIPLQSDFKKFDDNLRMVLDCTLVQANAIEELLLQSQENDKIIFGIHKSKRALVTCITHTVSKGEHIHFVDGENCGYTMAALNLKKQII